MRFRTVVLKTNQPNAAQRCTLGVLADRQKARIEFLARRSPRPEARRQPGRH